MAKAIELGLFGTGLTYLVGCISQPEQKPVEVPNQKPTLEQITADTQKVIPESTLKYLKIPQYDDVIGKITVLKVLELTGDNNAKSLDICFLMMERDPGTYAHQVFKQRALELKHSMEKEGTWKKNIGETKLYDPKKLMVSPTELRSDIDPKYQRAIQRPTNESDN